MKALLTIIAASVLTGCVASPPREWRTEEQKAYDVAQKEIWGTQYSDDYMNQVNPRGARDRRKFKDSMVASRVPRIQEFCKLMTQDSPEDYDACFTYENTKPILGGAYSSVYGGGDPTCLVQRCGWRRASKMSSHDHDHNNGHKDY